MIQDINHPQWEQDKWIIKFFEQNPDIGTELEGVTEDDLQNKEYQLEVKDNEFTDLQFASDDIIKVYKYVSDVYGSKGFGPNTRPFCKRLVMMKGKVFTQSEIVRLNNAPGKADRAGGGGYSVFKYRGGNNCVHHWVAYNYDNENKQLLQRSFIQPPNPPV